MAATNYIELTNQKEKELIHLREKQQQAIERTLKSCQEELQEEQKKRKLLEDDFRYNLSLIEQRDQDLMKYEAVFEELKKVINSRMCEMSDLRVQIADLQGKLEDSDKDKGELKKYYIQRLDQQQTHLEQYCKSKDNEVTQQRTEYDRLQKQLQQRLLQVEEELAMEKQRMIAEKDDCQRTMEQEHRVKLDELTAQVLSKDSHLRQLQRELALAQNGVEQKHKDATTMEGNLREMETKLREMEWTHTDEVNALQARITELEGQLSHAETTNKTLRTDSDNRRIELERSLREKETIIQTTKESCIKKQTELERELGEVRALLEQAEVEGRRKEWNHNDNMKEKELQIEKLQRDMIRVREESERKIAQHAQEMVQHDLQSQALQTSCEKLKAEVTARIQDIERYKHELHLANERERSIERSKAQLELDWQTRLEDMERSQYGRQEQLIKTLTTARDEAIVQCRQVESKLMERIKVCESIRQERDIALDTLQKKGLTNVAREILQGRGSTEAMEILQRQNHELREVIRHMRIEMEKMATSKPNSEGVEMTGKQTVSTDQRYKMNKGYVLYLESEIDRLLQENKQLKSNQAAMKPPPAATSKNQPKKKTQKPKETQPAKVPPVMKAVLDKLQMEKATQEFDMAELRSHIRQLEATIKSQQHQVYLQKVDQIPKDKLHEKLLQATKVIISLVEERDRMRNQVTELKRKIVLLENSLAQLKNQNEAEDGEESTSDEEETDTTIEGDQQQQQQQQPSMEYKYYNPAYPLVDPAHPPVDPAHPLVVSHSVYDNPLSWSLGDTHGTPPMTSCTPGSLLEDVPTATKEDISLSPLKFSDSSFSSGLQAFNNVMKMVDIEGVSTTQSSPVEDHRKQKGKENVKPNPPLTVEGSHVRTNKPVKKGVTYKAPPLKQRKPKIRNYNNKE